MRRSHASNVKRRPGQNQQTREGYCIPDQAYDEIKPDSTTKKSTPAVERHRRSCRTPSPWSTKCLQTTLCDARASIIG